MMSASIVTPTKGMVLAHALLGPMDGPLRSRSIHFAERTSSAVPKTAGMTEAKQSVANRKYSMSPN